MTFPRPLLIWNHIWMVVLILLSLPLAAQNSVPDRPEGAELAQPEAAQPATEKIDLDMYQRISDQAFNHSEVMGFAGALADDIGPRLTGSPNMAKANQWTRDQLAAMGCANAHLESWGESGMGWQQLNTWVRMVTPDTAVFIAQATPWSPATNGAVTGDVIWVNIEQEEDFDRYKGKLAGKIVLLGPMRPVPPVDEPLQQRYADAQLKEMAELSSEDPARIRNTKGLAGSRKRGDLRDKIAHFWLTNRWPR